MMNRVANRSGAMTMVSAAVVVALLIGFGVCGARQIGATHRTMNFLEVNRRLEATGDNAIEEACARFEDAPPVHKDLSPVKLVVVHPVSTRADDPQMDVGPVAIETTALEPQDDGTALGVLTAHVRVTLGTGRHPRSRGLEVRRYVKVSRDAAGTGAFVQIGLTDLYREVTP